jgi:SAM-dependent methyltransferase
MDREQLRTTFEQVPELYDRARPGYPDELFDDLASLTGLRPGARLLEIGCGTGQATLPLARRGYSVVCVELGAGLAALARRRLAPFPGVEVVNAGFESWEPELGGFDAVVAFTALHWIDPEQRYRKPARLLREGGHLAVGGTLHVRRQEGDSFWVDVQQDYDAVAPSEDNEAPPSPEAVASLRDEIESDELFEYVAWRRYLWDQAYTAEEYIALLNTYSGHRALDVGRREDLYGRIRRRIEARHGGRITKTYLTMLNVARRRS